MSIPAVITALLATDSAYGLQLHKEIVGRLPHRSTTNVGQIYSTLERLQRDGLITRAGTTPDGLPRYVATASGIEHAQSWLNAETLAARPDWSEFLDLSLLTASLVPDGVNAVRAAVESSTSRTERDTLFGVASSRLHGAMLEFLTDIENAVSAGEIVVRRIDQTRPARGRKPNHD
jgi:DNA-binding PadR family transcriptional regulator